MEFELLARCPFPHFRLGSQLLSGGRVFNGAGSEQEFSRARPVKQRDCLPQWLAAPGEWGLGPDSAHHRIWPSRLPGSSRVPGAPPPLLCLDPPISPCLCLSASLCLCLPSPIPCCHLPLFLLPCSISPIHRLFIPRGPLPLSSWQLLALAWRYRIS